MELSEKLINLNQFKEMSLVHRLSTTHLILLQEGWAYQHLSHP